MDKILGLNKENTAARCGASGEDFDNVEAQKKSKPIEHLIDSVE